MGEKLTTERIMCSVDLHMYDRGRERERCGVVWWSNCSFLELFLFSINFNHDMCARARRVVHNSIYILTKQWIEIINMLFSPSIATSNNFFSTDVVCVSFCFIAGSRLGLLFARSFYKYMYVWRVFKYIRIRKGLFLTCIEPWTKRAQKKPSV